MCRVRVRRSVSTILGAAIALLAFLALGAVMLYSQAEYSRLQEAALARAREELRLVPVVNSSGVYVGVLNVGSVTVSVRYVVAVNLSSGRVVHVSSLVDTLSPGDPWRLYEVFHGEFRAGRLDISVVTGRGSVFHLDPSPEVTGGDGILDPGEGLGAPGLPVATPQGATPDDVVKAQWLISALGTDNYAALGLLEDELLDVKYFEVDLPATYARGYALVDDYRWSSWRWMNSTAVIDGYRYSEGESGRVAYVSPGTAVYGPHSNTTVVVYERVLYEDEYVRIVLVNVTVSAYSRVETWYSSFWRAYMARTDASVSISYLLRVEPKVPRVLVMIDQSWLPLSSDQTRTASGGPGSSIGNGGTTIGVSGSSLINGYYVVDVHGTAWVRLYTTAYAKKVIGSVRDIYPAYYVTSRASTVASGGGALGIVVAAYG